MKLEMKRIFCENPINLEITYKHVNLWQFIFKLIRANYLNARSRGVFYAR